MSTTVSGAARRDARRLRATAGLATLVSALVLGILGMHAVAGHGTTASGDHLAAAARAAGTAMVMAGVAASPGAPDASPVTGSAATASAPASGHGMGVMAICLAILAGSAALLVAARAAWRILHGCWGRLRRPSGRLFGIRWVRGGTGPPPEWAFSVIRC